MDVIQGQLVILAIPGVSHPGTCGIVIHANGPAAITVHFKGPDGILSHATATSEQLRPYTGACPVCDTKPAEKHRFSTCAECGHLWVDPGWLYSGTNMAAADPIEERVRAITPQCRSAIDRGRCTRTPCTSKEAVLRLIREGGADLMIVEEPTFWLEAPALSHFAIRFDDRILGDAARAISLEAIANPADAPRPNQAFISRYPTEHDLVEALRGPITGAQIRAAREAAGMSIYALGNKLEVPFALTDAIEREPEATLSPLGWRRLLEIFPALAESPERTTIPLSEVADRWLADPEFRAGYEALEIPMALEQARTRAGLTQDELATRMGTSQSTINRLERGRGAPPTVTTLQRWAAATGTQLTITLRPGATPTRP